MPAPTYRFGDYRLDPATRELQRSGELVALPPRAFDCLAYLVERRERAVGRDELIAAVWGKAEVSDTLLAQTILRVRRAVGDTGNEQHAVRTVPRFGYRWVVPTEVVTAPERGEPRRETAAASLAIPEPPAAAGAAPAATQRAPSRTAPPVQPPSPRPLWPWLVAAAAAVLLALGLWRLSADKPVTATGSGTEPRLSSNAAIVLPVELDEGAEWSWVRLGGMDFIASHLRASGQAALPSDTTLVLLARQPAPRSTASDLKAARDSGARLVLQPQARRLAGQWQVSIAAYATDGSRRQGEGRADTVLQASEQALQQLLGAGLAEPRAGSQRAEHLQRAEAALLADDLATARRELDAVAASADDAELAYRRSQIDFRAGDYEGVDQRLLPLLQKLDAKTQAGLRGQVLNGLGSIAIRRNQMLAGERYFSEAVNLLRNRGDARALGQAYTGLAITQAAQHRFDLALGTFAHARVELEKAGDELAVARVDANLGILDIERKRYPEAVTGLRRAAARFAAFGAVNEQLTSLIGLARAQAEMLDTAGASQTADEFWSLAARSASPRLRHQMAVVRADVLAQCGRLQEARNLLAGLRRELELPAENDTQARADAVLARLALADGDAALALKLSDAGLEGLPEEQFERERAQLWLLRLRALRGLERFDEARRRLEEFQHWAGSTHDPAAPLYAGLASAELDWAQNRREPARQRYAELLNQADQAGVALDLALVVQSYGGALLDAGDSEAAAPVIARIARWADADFGCALLQVWAYWAQGDLPAWQQALQKARGLAGERPIAPILTQPPQPAQIH
ncbi:DNA-binding winged helix-turn-helix (wHTH) protein [Tahibacter aquaticus]|uniref:DNA-binding winged helix-turn-helix (WHTH) protein n=1 Tax=Tahibacter aquaticus TaxID=520092 RepID=A0A4R6YTX5_9GAMM|nr:transcriptional regulator [Tahibacter aquaticus]TDR41670.1 DNA-binding winged helix-turn-helix (wHTH) protein [Tahibacter aquaticus]